ncbi:MAG: hypothetical protein F4Y27_10775 [Acidimicrobiaceae bacterium]|nr:hypothetical protein [Acidimicrobiaceae bacterium]MYG56694.1 hypothetical protein [Acidimicrobiaceae bacterium]MYK00239.1 hypothetical protein [Acidimicrobiaceae bacterium]
MDNTTAERRRRACDALRDASRANLVAMETLETEDPYALSSPASDEATENLRLAVIAPRAVDVPYSDIALILDVPLDGLIDFYEHGGGLDPEYDGTEICWVCYLNGDPIIDATTTRRIEEIDKINDVDICDDCAKLIDARGR